MSLDNEDPRIIKWKVKFTKARSDFLAAVQALNLAVYCTLETLEDDLGMAGVMSNFSSALPANGSFAGAHLSDDSKKQYDRLFAYFQEMFEDS